ncbi:MAG TPA: tRNA (adenosine(37)-N6)-threonylcarbamoyltransferase complex transferase subunit TsaD [Thermoanaerobaculia bacterium]|nr:tRNA (adenosine(37)-N6)-threonylcarbamoyltransferase complex transferase subunit TsaD [Thermoanaerobaculia bacterium]
MPILGIETSCDETSVAILQADGRVDANLIASQIERHRPFGGVVPEIASREHLEHLMPLIREALDKGGVRREDLAGVAVTVGPGLIGALLVGVAAAQGLSWGLGIPLIAVNHLEGHIVSPYLRKGAAAIPLPRRFLSLVVSGGHSSIYDVRGGTPPRIWMVNRTRDDAAGEVFDKVAKFVGLPYPGGPHVERVGASGNSGAHAFPLPQFKDEAPDFSFSGLKANAIRLARQLGLQREQEKADETPELADFCASFQKAICDQVIDRLDRVWDGLGQGEDRPSDIALAGGVAANGELRRRITAWGSERNLVVRLPEREFCTDNAAMIGFAGLTLRGATGVTDPRRLKAASRLPVGLA